MAAKAQPWNVNEFGAVVIRLDRPRELKLTHRAMKTFSTLTGCRLEEMEEAIQDPVKLEALYYSMLKSDADKNGESLKVDDMEGLMDEATPGALLSAAGKAIELAFADADAAAGADPDPRAAAGQRKKA